MLGRSLASPVLTFQSSTHCYSSASEDATFTPNLAIVKLSFSHGITANAVHRRASISVFTSNKWKLHSTTQTQTVVLDDGERKMWEECRQALSAFNISVKDEDTILGKAFGHVHSPYWGEERKKEVPRLELVNEILDFLRSLGLSDDDLCKLLKKFPEVLGCSLDEEMRNNVQLLEKEWGIKGKSLRNLLLRNPKVLGYNVDCKGDCMAKCTRCWVRF